MNAPWGGNSGRLEKMARLGKTFPATFRARRGPKKRVWESPRGVRGGVPKDRRKGAREADGSGAAPIIERSARPAV